VPSPIAAASAAPQAPAPRPADPPPPGDRPGQSWTSPRDGLDYAWLPSASSFKIGCVGSDKECYDDEKPRKAVAFAQGFWLTKTEVTVAAYKRFAEATGRPLPSENPLFNPGWQRDELPMSYLSWDEAASFCAWAGGRLPTEAEWEYAARGGRDGNKYPWGQDPPACRKGAPNGARFNDGAACKDAVPDPVGTYAANRVGLFDVAGNVWEWCDDWYDPKAYAADAKSPAASKERVIRGGAMNSKASGLRLSLRNRLSPTSRSVYVGLRCVMD
jgi:formylglycine-generating enzyme required for sulfatase activity